MYEYKYVTLEGKSGFALLRLEEHRACIDHYPARGWRYVGYVPVKIDGHGVPIAIDLIFEREA